jgi:hypothetical protein
MAKRKAEQAVDEVIDAIIADSDPFYTRRTENVMVTLTPAEYMHLQGLAIQDKQSISNWIRVKLGFSELTDRRSRTRKDTGVKALTDDMTLLPKKVLSNVNTLLKGLE